MAAYISFQPTDFFIPKLYTGTAATNSITGVGFTPNYVWFKGRSGSISHQLYDTVRGNDSALVSSSDAAAIDATGDGFTSLDADGYTFNSSGGGGNVNGSGSTYVAWNWKAPTAFSGATTGSGTLKTYTASVSTTSGISITKYIGNGTSNHRIPHNLGAVPKIVIVKKLNASAGWVVMGTNMLTSSNYYLSLQTTAAQDDGAGTVFYSWPSSTYFGIGTAGTTNTNDGNYIAYSFAPIKGYSSFGTYEGNGNVDGPFIYTGFRPAFVMIKNIDRSEAWDMYDTKRNPFNLGTSKLLQANSDVAENATSTIDIDILSNGFKVRTTSTEINLSTSMYMAFAEFPFVSSNSKAGTAR
jgi:hypothetical protein